MKRSNAATRRRNRSLSAAAFALLLGVATPPLLGCESDGPLEEVGEEADDALDDAGDAIEDAGDEVEDALDD